MLTQKLIHWRTIHERYISGLNKLRLQLLLLWSWASPRQASCQKLADWMIHLLDFLQHTDSFHLEPWSCRTPRTSSRNHPSQLYILFQSPPPMSPRRTLYSCSKHQLHHRIQFCQLKCNTLKSINSITPGTSPKSMTFLWISCGWFQNHNAGQWISDM